MRAALGLAGSLAACTEPRAAVEPSTAGTAAAPERGTSASVAPTAATPPAPAEHATPASGGAPATAVPSPSAALPPAALPPAALPPAAQVPAAGAAPSAATAPSAAASPTDPELAPVLLAADGAPLPQTRDRPDTASPGFRRRLELLVEAIAHDDPERALPAFFPRVAYQLVKAIPDPSRDWETRLVRAFRRDIHDYHRLLGPDAASARLAGIVTNERAVRWMEPGAEGNRVGYHRVTRSRLKVGLVNGGTRELELTSLISWRGAWYVVHLHGFS